MEGPSEFVPLESDDEEIPEEEEGDCDDEIPEQEGDCDEEIPEWMDFPEEEWEDDSEKKLRRVMCIAWMDARKEFMKLQPRVSMDSEIPVGQLGVLMRPWNIPDDRRSEETRRRKEEMRRRSEERRGVWGELSPEEELRAGWKVSEMDLLSELMFLIWGKKGIELDGSYALKRQLKEAQEKGLQLEEELMDTQYHKFRNKWIATHSSWGGVFENITNIRSMGHTDNPVPRYVYIHGPPDTLQIFSIKVQRKILSIKAVTKEKRASAPSLFWPLHVFGLIAVRDPIDQNRNIIFNRQRYECQTLTEEDPYLVLTGPTRAVVIDDKSIPVTIEAELKVRGSDESEDKCLIFGAKPVPSEIHSGLFNIVSGLVRLRIELERVMTCVESTIFLRIIDGTWPTGCNGQFTACTSRYKQKKIMLVEFRGDLPVDGGIVEQSRFVVSVEVLGELIISYKAWRDAEVLRGEVSFRAEKKGRSRQSFQIGSCTFEAIVAWSPIRPVCEELVSMEEMDLTK